MQRKLRAPIDRARRQSRHWPSCRPRSVRGQDLHYREADASAGRRQRGSRTDLQIADWKGTAAAERGMATSRCAHRPRAHTSRLAVARGVRAAVRGCRMSQATARNALLPSGAVLRAAWFHAGRDVDGGPLRTGLVRDGEATPSLRPKPSTRMKPGSYQLRAG
jgi:hypothetical protein